MIIWVILGCVYVQKLENQVVVCVLILSLPLLASSE